MSQPPLPLPRKIVDDVEKKIDEVIDIGTEIRSILGSRNDEEEWGEKWEVNAAVESLNILSGSSPNLTNLFFASSFAAK